MSSLGSTADWVAWMFGGDEFSGESDEIITEKMFFGNSK
jgi:hypothetical protein